MSNESNGEFLENKPQQVQSQDESAQQEATREIAFKDFKNAITTEEFLAVLEIARHEYDQMTRAVAGRDRFAKKTDDGIEQIKSQEGSMPPKLAEKLIAGLKRRANDKLHEQFSKEIARHRSITDFLNRFQTSDQLLPYLNF